MPVYPGDEPVRLEQIRRYEQEGNSDFRFTCSMHSGTHIDGPMHMSPGLQFIGDIFIERFAGRGCIIDAQQQEIIECRTQYRSEILPGSIVIVHTGFGKYFGTEKYYKDYPAVSPELAGLLIEKNVKMLCLDTPSPDRDPHQIHKILLGNRILIAENLANTEQLINVPSFEIIALPLRLQADSSPARIVAVI